MYANAVVKCWGQILCDYFTKRTALLGPKDLPIIARTVGRLAGRAIGYVQLARGQFDNIMQQNQARQVFLYPPRLPPPNV